MIAAGRCRGHSRCGRFRREPSLTRCAVWAKLPGVVAGGSVVARMDEKDGFRGWDMWVQNGALASHLIHHWNDRCASRSSANQPMDPGQVASPLRHLRRLRQRGRSEALCRRPAASRRISKPTTSRDSTRTTRSLQDRPARLDLADQRAGGAGSAAVCAVALDAGGAVACQIESPGRRALPSPPRSEPSRRRTSFLTGGWRTTDEPFKKASAKLAALEQEQNAIQGRGATTLVMQEKAEPAKAYVLYPRRLRQATRRGGARYSRFAASRIPRTHRTTGWASRSGCCGRRTR